jgi:hypothetical protein
MPFLRSSYLSLPDGHKPPPKNQALKDVTLNTSCPSETNADQGDHPVLIQPDERERTGAAGTPTVHQNALDGLRAIAALLVLLFHTAAITGNLNNLSGATNWLLSRGEIAVPIFFALSGLLLYRPWVQATLEPRQTPSVHRYLRKRALRILPAYWVAASAALLLYSRGHVTDIRTWTEVLTLT